MFDLFEVAMQKSYTIQQQPDQSWAVLVADSGAPVRLAGISQVGLKLIEAEVLLEALGGASRAGETGPATSNSALSANGRPG